MSLTPKCGADNAEPLKVVDLTAQASLISQLAEAVCKYRDIDPLEAGFSLYDHIDTEALETLVASRSDGLHLQFTIEDVTVCIWKPDAETANIYVSDNQE